MLPLREIGPAKGVKKVQNLAEEALEHFQNLFSGKENRLPLIFDWFVEKLIA